MDYEEKLQEAKRLYKTANSDQRYVLESLFPELKESEDERIRKEIIVHIKWCEDNGYCAKEEMTRWINWLEKQVSLKDIVDRHKKSWYNEGKIAGMTEGLTDDEKYQQGWHDAMEIQSEEFDSNIITNDDEILQAISIGLTDAVEDLGWSDFGGVPIEEIQDWLKKQGEQKVSYTTLVETGNGGINALVTRELSTNGCDEQKPAWSEEDEKHIDSLLERLEGMCKKGATFTKTRFAISQDMDWLKSLKERIGG